MFGKKNLLKTLEQNEIKIKELNARLEEYQQKNDAVVCALTDAKSAANRIIGAAEVKRDEIIAAAEQERKDIEAQRGMILKKAREEASAIVSAARADAEKAEAQANYFRRYVKDSADAVRRQAENYAAFMEDYNAAGIGETPLSEEIKTPENYHNPAELMHSIYAIQGRELPDEEKQEKNGKKPAECDGDQGVITVNDVPDNSCDPADSAIDSELNDILNDILKLD